MKQKKKDRKRVLFFRFDRKIQTFYTFFTSYLLVLLIPTTMAIALSFITLNHIKSSEIEAHEMIYQSLLSDLNSKTRQAHALNNLVRNNLQDNPYHMADERNYFAEFKLRNDLNQMMVGVRGISNIYLFLPQFDLVISPEEVRPSEQFVAQHYEIAHEEWLSMMDSSRNLLDTKAITLAKGDDKQIIMHQSLAKVMLEDDVLHSTTIVIEIDIDDFESGFSKSNPDGSNGYAILLDDEVIRTSFASDDVDDILHAYNELIHLTEERAETEISEKRFYSFLGHVDYSQFALLSMADVNRQDGWYQLNHLVILTLIVNIITSIVISSLLAKRKVRPMMKVADLISKNIIRDIDMHSVKIAEEVEYLSTDQLITRFIHQVNDYKALVDYSTSTVRDLYMERLIRGEIVEQDQDILAVFELYDIRLNFAACRLAYIIPAMKDDELTSDMWESEDIAKTWHLELGILLEKLHGPDTISFVFQDEDMSAHLMLYSEVDMTKSYQEQFYDLLSANDQEELNAASGENIRVLLSRLNDELIKNYGISFSMLISDPVMSPSEFGSIYNQLRERKLRITEALETVEADSDIYADLVQQCIEIIEEEFFNADMNVEYIAANLDVSQPYLSRLFKQETGTGLLDYIHMYRVEEAKKCFARNPDSLIKDVADECGFINAASFIRVFKKIAGNTPGQYRNQLLNL